jgi:uncharacterized alkaline shock family protein YloU
MGARKINALGEIVISDEVLATLAGVTAVKCYGIVGMASKRASDGIVQLLGIENLSRGVKVQTAEDEIQIDLYIIVEYGVSISTVAKNVIETVKYSVENYTGLAVDRVNVFVESVRV